MKKMIFSAAAFALVAVSSIALAPTTASAIPAFARQTGAACYSCHFQTFPAIKAFGRAFKMGSFTDVGDQALIEDDNLSIPAVLNATFVVKGNAVNTDVTNQASTTVYNVPTDAVLMMAGRIGSNTGAFIEFDGGAANWQLINSFDVSGFKVGIGAAKAGFGGSGVLELSNVFGQHGGVLFGKGISAIQAAGFSEDTTSIGAWIGNDLGVVQFALLAPAAATEGTVNVGGSFGKLVRVIATLDVGGWDTLIGFGTVTGSAGKGDTSGGLTATRIPMNLQFVDAQVQGEVGDMSIGIYGDWAHAKGKTSTTGSPNFYGGALATTTAGTGLFALNTTTGVIEQAVPGVTSGENNINSKFDAYSIRTTIQPIDHVIALVGYGYQKLTQVGGDVTNKEFQLGLNYSLYQNMELKLIYNSAKLTSVANGAITTRTTTFEVEALM